MTFIRIVHMHFKEDAVAEFLEIFQSNKEAIRNVEGCVHLELLRDTSNPALLTTLSYWTETRFLEHYRHSALFRDVWGKVRKLFSKPAEAFTLEKFIDA